MQRVALWPALRGRQQFHPRPARWFALADSARGGPPRSGTLRLTTYVDRTATIKTRSALFCPVGDFSVEPPGPALVPVGDRAAFDHWAALPLPACRFADEVPERPGAIHRRLARHAH